jgi:hypothetical protein
MATTRYRVSKKTNGGIIVGVECFLIGLIIGGAVKTWLNSTQWALILGISSGITFYALFLFVRVARYLISISFSIIWGGLVGLILFTHFGKVPFSIFIGLIVFGISLSAHSFYFSFRANASTTYRSTR